MNVAANIAPGLDLQDKRSINYYICHSEQIFIKSII